MERLEIFLDERSVVLLSDKPAETDPESMIIHYTDALHTGKVFEEFTKDPSLKRLVLYDDGDISVLKKSFFSLFTYVEAAGGKVYNEKGEILVIYRYGRWDLPKGKINRGKKRETPPEAAIREVAEETGLETVRVGKELPSTYHIFRIDKKRILKRTWWFEMLSESTFKLIPQKEEDISVVKWVSKEQLNNIRDNTYASLRNMMT